jgi:hypothetical protein
MAQKPLRGVGGVLNNLISASGEVPPATAEGKPGEDQVVPQLHMSEPEEARPTTPRETTVARDPGSRGKKNARRGRPPAGTRTSEPVEREKVSLRLRADLAATYRDWSWEEHCQFSDLVDRALEHYLRSQKKARKPEKE